MRILYTGFEPFGGERTNPSFKALGLLPDAIAGAQVLRLKLPVSFRGGPEKLSRALEQYRPDCVICVGQAGGRTAVTPEYVAINCANARIPDNDGMQPQDSRLCDAGPAAYFSTLPVHAIADSCRSLGIPAAVSYTAGTYVCNALMYCLLREIEQKYPAMIGGFIHVPYSSAQAAEKDPPVPGMELRLMADALRIAGELSLDAAKANADKG